MSEYVAMVLDECPAARPLRPSELPRIYQVAELPEGTIGRTVVGFQDQETGWVAAFVVCFKLADVVAATE